MALDYNEGYWLVVDGVKWNGHDAGCYAREVFRVVRQLRDAESLERSREYARKLTKAN